MEIEEPEPMNEADRAVCATHTRVACQHRRQIGRMTAPEGQIGEKCGLGTQPTSRQILAGTGPAGELVLLFDMRAENRTGPPSATRRHGAFRAYRLPVVV